MAPAPKYHKLAKFTKTKLCPHQKDGTCRKGENCTFAHSADELKAIPELRKTKLCPFYSPGWCLEGDSCRFAHGQADLRATTDVWKTRLCDLFAVGKCSVDNCRFAHGTEELRPANCIDFSFVGTTSASMSYSSLGDRDHPPSSLSGEDVQTNLQSSPSSTPPTQYRRTASSISSTACSRRHEDSPRSEGGTPLLSSTSDSDLLPVLPIGRHTSDGLPHTSKMPIRQRSFPLPSFPQATPLPPPSMLPIPACARLITSGFSNSVFVPPPPPDSPARHSRSCLLQAPPLPPPTRFIPNPPATPSPKPSPPVTPSNSPTSAPQRTSGGGGASFFIQSPTAVTLWPAEGEWCPWLSEESHAKSFKCKAPRVQEPSFPDIWATLIDPTKEDKLKNRGASQPSVNRGPRRSGRPFGEGPFGHEIGGGGLLSRSPWSDASAPPMAAGTPCTLKGPVSSSTDDQIRESASQENRNVPLSAPLLTHIPERTLKQGYSLASTPIRNSSLLCLERSWNPPESAAPVLEPEGIAASCAESVLRMFEEQSKSACFGDSLFPSASVDLFEDCGSPASSCRSPVSSCEQFCPGGECDSPTSVSGCEAGDEGLCESCNIVSLAAVSIAHSGSGLTVSRGTDGLRTAVEDGGRPLLSFPSSNAPEWAACVSRRATTYSWENSNREDALEPSESEEQRKTSYREFIYGTDLLYGGVPSAVADEHLHLFPFVARAMQTLSSLLSGCPAPGRGVRNGIS